MAKKEYEDTQDVAPILIYPNDTSEKFVKRELYKKLFSDIGLTLHKTSTYQQFFDRPAGAVAQTATDIPEPEDAQPHELFGDQENPHGLGLEHYSDGKLQTDMYYKAYMLNSRHINIDDSLATIYNNDITDPLTLPNNFKAFLYSKGSSLAHIQNTFSQAAKGANSAAQSTSTGFMFMHMNLTARVEIFKTQDSQDSSPLKDDASRWKLLTNEELNSFNDKGTDSSILFCRLSFYDENLVKGLDLPILDKYFNITK